MLVISRKVGERVIIGEHIAIQVTEIRKGRIRIGIQAPPDVLIRRDEQSPHGSPAQKLVPVGTTVPEGV